MVLIAVAQAGRAMEHAHYDLQGDKEIALVAVAQDPQARSASQARPGQARPGDGQSSQEAPGKKKASAIHHGPPAAQAMHYLEDSLKDDLDVLLKVGPGAAHGRLRYRAPVTKETLSMYL